MVSMSENCIKGWDLNCSRAEVVSNSKCAWKVAASEVGWSLLTGTAVCWVEGSNTLIFGGCNGITYLSMTGAVGRRLSLPFAGWRDPIGKKCYLKVCESIDRLLLVVSTGYAMYLSI
jgi:hypothetical protein